MGPKNKHSYRWENPDFNNYQGSFDSRYYSFEIGHADSPMENWIKLDVKQPAQTPKEAIYLHYLSSWILVHSKKWSL